MMHFLRHTATCPSVLKCMLSLSVHLLRLPILIQEADLGLEVVGDEVLRIDLTSLLLRILVSLI